MVVVLGLPGDTKTGEVVSSARTDEVLKVIVANPTMIDAYRAGVPGNGKALSPTAPRSRSSNGSRKKSTEAPFVVDVPDTFSQAFFIEKDSKRFPNSAGWGIRACSTMTPRPTRSRPMRVADNCGHACHYGSEGKGLHLSPVPEALNGFGDDGSEAPRLPSKLGKAAR